MKMFSPKACVKIGHSNVSTIHETGKCEEVVSEIQPGHSGYWRNEVEPMWYSKNPRVRLILTFNTPKYLNFMKVTINEL